jgi:hypothetical protein
MECVSCEVRTQFLSVIYISLVLHMVKFSFKMRIAICCWRYFEQVYTVRCCQATESSCTSREH